MSQIGKARGKAKDAVRGGIRKGSLEAGVSHTARHMSHSKRPGLPRTSLDWLFEDREQLRFGYTGDELGVFLPLTDALEGVANEQ